MSGQTFILFTSKMDVERKGKDLSNAMQQSRWESFNEASVLLIDRPDTAGVADVAIVGEPDSGDYGNLLYGRIVKELKAWRNGNECCIGVALHEHSRNVWEDQRDIIKEVFTNCEPEERFYSHGAYEPYTLFVSVARSSGEKYQLAIKCLNDFFRPNGYEAAHELLLELLPDYLKGDIAEREAGVLTDRWGRLKRKIEQQRHWDGATSEGGGRFAELDGLVECLETESSPSSFVEKYEELYKKLGTVVEW